MDVSGVDWATVDLMTIDWANIDLSQVDFSAVERNPTAQNVDEQTVALIRSRMNPGRATLTIGELTWEFDSFLCAFGHDATMSDVYAFSSDSRGEHEGVGVQMQANIRDESGQGRFEGSGLEHEVYIQDVEDFENPIIDLEMSAPDGIRIEGNTVTAEGMFDDKRASGAAEAIPGTDTTRRDILRRAIAGEPSVSRLADASPMSFAAVQKHVAVLERAGLVTEERHGWEQLVRTVPEGIDRAREALDRLEASWRGGVGRMADLLTEGPDTGPNTDERGSHP